MTPDVDYRELLSKYINHVALCEGTAFMADFYRARTEHEGQLFTDQEWAELQTIADAT